MDPLDPQSELAARYGYTGTIDVDRSPARASIDDLLIMLAADRMGCARMLAKQTAILNDNAADSVSGRAASAIAAGQLATHIGELGILDMVISQLVQAALRLDGLSTRAITEEGLERATAAFRQLIDSAAPAEYDRMRVRIILEQAGGASRRTALLTAAQTGQVMVGVYATVPVILSLVEEGLGTAIADGDQLKQVTGFQINDRGRAEAERLELDYRCTRDTGCPVHPGVEGVHTNAMRQVEY